MFLTKKGALRSLALTIALGGTVAALGAPAAGAAPTRIDAEYWGVSCVHALGGGETLFLFGSGTTDGAEGGVGAFVENADGAMVAEGFTTDFTFADSFATSLDLAGTTFAISADVDRGATETAAMNERDGNGWTKGTTSQTSLEVTATEASYGGQPVDLSAGGCSGDITGFDVRTTNPAAQIHHDEDFDSAICDVDGLPDAQVRVTGALPDVVVEVVADHGGEDVEQAEGEITLRGGRGTLSTDLVDVYTGETRTTATIGVELERSGSATREIESGEGIVERRTVTPYDETISVVLADGRAGTASCSGVAVSTQVRIAPTAEA